MKVRLVLVAPADQKRAISVSLPAVVGRSPDATLRIAQESVSRRHCELFATDGAVFLRDLGSTNGTRIGAERITASAAIAIEPGSVIKVGEAVFRVEYERAARQVRSPVVAPATPPAAPVDAMGIPDLHLPEAAEPVSDQVDDARPETDAVAMSDVPPPPLQDAFPLPPDDIAEPATSFDFVAPDLPPAATEDASLDDFLKGLQ